MSTRIKRVSLSLMMFSLAIGCWAQTQQGFVKTLGRPDKKGVALSGVSVRVKGGHNAVLSKADGTFSMVMTGKKVGDAYSLQQVQKSGYELNETGVIGRQYAFSDKVPLTITMVSTAQLQADKQRIENNAYQVAEKNYHAKLSQLEKDKETGAITIDQYRQQIQDLQDKFEKYQSLIDDLADHYAHVDYDNLDEKEREINLCIENGDLERADSLIHTLFDPVDVLKRNKDALAKIEQQEAQAQDILAQANADMAAVLKQQEKDAEYLYHLYTIALARFDNEKAQFYITTRAELDTVNAHWQLDAGVFYFRYTTNMDKARTYYQRALNVIVTFVGKQHPDVASLYNNIGLLFKEQADYTKAIHYFTKALDIYKAWFGENSFDVASTYNNIGTTYYAQKKYNDAEKYFQKATEIQSGPANSLIEMAAFYNNSGLIVQKQKDYDKAMTYYRKALKLIKDNIGEENQDAATSISNIGTIYYDLHQNDSALVYSYRAFEIRKHIFGEKHPKVADSYFNLGRIYSEMGQFVPALKYHETALSIRKETLSEMSPEVANSYENVAFLNYKLSNYDKALENYHKQLGIRTAIMPPDDISLAYIYGGLGSTYYRLNQLDSALVYYQKCLDIKKKVQGDYNMDVCEPYKVIALIYRNKLSDYPRALDYYSHAVSIEETVLGSQHNDTQKDYAWMSLSYQQYAQKLLEEEKMDDALLALQRSNAIMTNLTPANTESGKPWKAVNDLTIASILLMKKDFACAYQAYVNAKPMFLEFCQQNIEGAESQYATLLGNLAYSSLFLKKFKEAEKYAREGLAVDSTLHVIASNLAVALLFQDKYEEAEEIYRNYKDELKDGFLDDFEQFAQAGIIPKKCKPELERIKKLLME